MRESTGHKLRLGLVIAWAVALTIGAITAVVWLTGDRADAATPQPEPVCATWQARGGKMVEGTWTWGGTPAGTVITEGSAKLVKPDGPEGSMPGVEFAAFDLDIEATTETYVAVKYELGGGAATSAGAVRFFGYQAKNANTVTTGPDWSKVAVPDQGTLLFTLAAGEKLGTLGVVYDGSNTATGWVTFTEMTIGGRPVSFTTCEPPATTPPATTAPATTAPPATTPPVTVEPSATVPPVAGGPELPVTGVGIWQILGAGGMLIALGLVTALLFRPKRVRTMI